MFHLISSGDLKNSIFAHNVFAHNYEVEVLPSWAPPAERVPGEPTAYHFPAMLEEDVRAACLRVLPHGGRAWTGFFALGFDSEQTVSAVCSCPDPDFVCAIVGGYGYMVNVMNPTQWTRVEQRPIVEARPVPELGLLLFKGFTAITAFAASGHLWTTGRLSWEGVSIARIDLQSRTLHGSGWDALADQDAPFEVDLLTGKHTGGARL